VANIADDLIRRGCAYEDVLSSLRFGAVLCGVDLAVFPHRPAWVGFNVIGSSSLAGYSPKDDEYHIFVPGLHHTLSREAMGAGLMLAMSDITTSPEVSVGMARWGIAAHEVRHRLQCHVGDDLRLWPGRGSHDLICRKAIGAVQGLLMPANHCESELDAMFIEYYSYIARILVGKQNIVDTVWLEPEA